MYENTVYSTRWGFISSLSHLSLIFLSSLSRLDVRAHSIHGRLAEAHGGSTKCHCLNDVRAAPDPTVDPDLQALFKGRAKPILEYNSVVYIEIACVHDTGWVISLYE